MHENKFIYRNIKYILKIELNIKYIINLLLLYYNL